MSDRHTVTFRADEEMVAALDALAERLSRSRTHVLKESVRLYLELHAWQVQHVSAGLQQADAGEFASDADVEAELAAWSVAPATVR